MKSSPVSAASAGISAFPQAVVGWLLVLCLLLTIVYPAMSLYYIVWRIIPHLISASASVQILLLSVYVVLFTVLAVYSFMAGTKLWLVKPRAVEFARRYLLVYLIANIGYFIFWMLLVRPTQAISVAAMAWYHVVSPLPFTTLWYSYLEHSKRVRATYPSS
jgi:hypothetical protein